ncbi:Dolichyl-diphosphooligosaccharide--protein glycosyltransferase subunit 2 [Camellia lanceoleosa]|uniref:Dolichyl-diphosphooligosaccharide--protein glycosyltransferase subunit 2 n=1 Tax=Camellia lanceoleosa TaxID=1840588 RepID=A0ACC0F9F6_9ERIC|nr:Dolichyl-diphosphooligosaccharide--protein glycosyltransferase subunit 2 [Camellia lanceoleosa]
MSLEVRVNTILGSAAPSLSVKLKQAFSSGSKDASIIESQFDQENDVHFLDAWPKSVNVGNFIFVFEAFLKLKHETKVEHIFVWENSGEQFEITLVSSSDQSNLKFHFLLFRIYRS